MGVEEAEAFGEVAGVGDDSEYGWGTPQCGWGNGGENGCDVGIGIGEENGRGVCVRGWAGAEGLGDREGFCGGRRQEVGNGLWG